MLGLPLLVLDLTILHSVSDSVALCDKVGHMDSLQSWFRARWFAIGGALLTAAVLLAAGCGLLDVYRARLILDAQEAVLSSVPPQVAALTLAVNRRLSVVSALRAFTVIDPSPARLDAEFQTFVADLVASVGGIRNLSLAPDGVQTYVYPMEGSEGVMGHDLMTDARSEVRADVARAIETGTIALSGPYDLRQGGLGLVVRLAVTHDGVFWGLVAAVLDIPPLLDDAGLIPLTPGVTYALVGSDGRVFAGDEDVLLQDPVTAVVTLPESEWTLAVVPVEGWAAAVRGPLRVARVAGIFLVGLASGGVYLLISRERQNLNTAQGFARDLAATQTRYRRLFERDEASWTELTQVANLDALKISLVYMVLGSLWILLSDRLLVTFGLSTAVLTQFQTLKGGVFVVATGLLLYFIVRRRLVRVHQSMALAATSEKMYRVLTENTPDVIWQMDLDFRFTYINPAVEDLLGYAPNEVVGMSLAAYTPDEDLQRMESRIAKALNSEEYSGVAQIRCKLRHRGGYLVPVEIRGNIIVDGGRPVGVQGLVRDLRGRDRAEREREQLLAKIQEQALLVERIIDTVPDGVLALDVWHRPTLVNPAAEQILGSLAQYGPGEGDALAHLGDRPLAELLTPPPRGLRHEVRMEDHVFEVVACPLEAPPVSDDAPDDRWVLVLHDVTSEREVRTRIEEQVRLSALGQMAVGIAHDFNDNLAAVMLYTQMALRAPDLGSAIQERLQVVLDQAERATALVQQLLDFGRGGVIELHEMDLVGLLEKESLLLQRTLPKSIVVTFTHSDEPCLVSADPRRLQQAVVNLAVNARDAMPGGGELRLAVSRIQIDATSAPPIPSLSEGRWVQITVEDTGEGMPEEVVSRIFEPFFTTKDPGEGGGLGLAQVYGIIQQHGGQIGVVSDVGRGTRFTICLPAVQVSATGDELADLASAPRGMGELVLLVEDHAATRVALVESLELLNYRVVTAVHGGEALAVLDDQGHDIAVVLSDYVMPEVNGRELFFALKSRGFPVPMVILTGHPVTADLDDLLEDGLCGWLPKPPDLARLAHLLARALGG